MVSNDRLTGQGPGNGEMEEAALRTDPNAPHGHSQQQPRRIQDVTIVEETRLALINNYYCPSVLPRNLIMKA